MKKLLFVLISLFLINSVYSFTQTITPTNNSILTQLNQTITTTITATENTSTFINWDNSLVGYWNFDSANSTHVYDIIDSNHGEYLGDIFVSNQDNIRGDYGVFDGDNDYINLGIHTSEDIFYSISIWFNSSKTGPLETIFSRGQSTSQCFYNPVILVNLTILQVTESGCSSTGLITTYSINSSWNHIVVTRNDEIVKVYLNGEQIVVDLSQPNPLGTNLGRSSIGSFWSNPSYDRFFNGSIDEVMIFNRTLSEPEIKSLYNSQVHNFQFNTTNLNNNTNYNYEIFTINTTGHLLKQSYNFYTNTSYIIEIPQTQTQSTTKLPSQSIISVIISIFVILSVLLI